MADNQNRKLAAILFADIVGYTALMQKDDATANVLLDKFHQTLNTTVTAHKGEVINNYGDGCVCTFDSAVNAMRCAKEVQGVFQQEPKVPVRLGLHSGDVLFKENNVYGDSVNIASRIESLGVAGAVLFSERIKENTANQSEFQAQSVGSFEFKNVKKPMEVFALANEGMVVPKREDMKGKLKDPKNTSNKLLYLLPALFIISLTSFYFLKQDKTLLGKNDFSENSAKVSEELRTKRVMVVPFENQTQNESLKIFGNMVADWLTQGLIEMNDVNVISAENLSGDLAYEDSNNELVRTTGIDIKIVGRYYIVEDQVVIHANLVDARSGEIIKNLSNIKGDQKDLMKIIENLSEEVLGFWATKDKIRFSRNPPTFKAYNNYLKGRASFSYNNWEKSEKYLMAAIAEDSTFYIGALKLLVGYRNYNPDKAAQVEAYLNRHKDEFTEWEKLRFQSVQLLDIEKVIDKNKQLFDLDRSAMDPFANILTWSRASLHLEIAIDFLEHLNDPIIDNNPNAQEIINEQVPIIYFFMEDYQKVIEYPIDPKDIDFFSVTDIIHLRALIRLKKMNEFENKFQIVLHKFGQRKRHEYFTSILYKAICDEFVMQEDNANLIQILGRFDAYNNTVSDKDIVHNNKGYIHWYGKKYQEAIQSWQKQKFFHDHQVNEAVRILLTILAHIKLGNKDQVDQLRPLLQFRYANGLTTNQKRMQTALEYANGVIAHHEGNDEKAIQHLKSAIKNGAFVNREIHTDYYYYFNFKNDPFLSNAFRSSPEFLELFQ